MRKTIYISERRNKAVAEFIKSLPQQEISYEAVKLMEDGLKWRGVGEDNDKVKNTVEKRSLGPVLPQEVSATPKEKVRFSDIRLKKATLGREDLERKLNNL